MFPNTPLQQWCISFSEKPVTVKETAIVAETDLQIHLIHELESQRVILVSQGNAVMIQTAWEIFGELLRYIKDELQIAWPATAIWYEIPCPHCLILRKPNPATLEPQLFLQKPLQYFRRIFQSQTHKTRERSKMTTVCGKDTDIPPALRGPCK